MLKHTIIILILLVVTACGSDGGGTTTPTNPNQSFSLSKLQSTEVGTVYSTQLTGNDSDGTTYTGTVSFANRSQITLDGVLVTPSDLILTLTGGGISVTVTGTSNIDTNGNLVSVVIQTTGLTCIPLSSDTMPASVKIGDFGILSTLTCDDNTTQERNWRIEDAGNGNVRVISNGTSKDQFNTIITITDVTFTLDGSGNIIGFKTVSTLSATSYTLTYESI